jgi:pimeloyl-ACP methyl ester carboxylesterase
MYDASGKKLDYFQDITVNGCKERVLIQSDDVESNPILLFLHGGPGSSEMLWSHVYERELRQNFIFVNWDQRGAGYSYRDDVDPATVSEAQIYQDALTLTRYLMKTFKRNKIFLVGHSFGSVIGLQLAADHPELFYAYIGVGQVIDYSRSVPIAYKWLHDILEKANDKDGLARIEKGHFPYMDLVIKYGGHHSPSVDLNEIMKGSPYYSDGYLERLQKGKDFSAEKVGKNRKLRTVARNSVYDISIPLYFLEGVNDHVIATAPELVAEFCAKVKAPVKKVIWFEASAHTPNVDEPQKFQDELVNIMKECMAPQQVMK